MGTCEHCGGALTDALSCPACGATVRGDASMMMPLAALRPEAEPPLPADHELLRNRTPARGTGTETRVERAIATPSRPVRVTASSPQLDPLELDPLSRVAPSPLLAAAPLDPIPEPPPELAHAVPSLTGSSRRGLLAVLLLLAVGATVGWLLSRDPPPTPDEVRAKSVQQHTQ